MNKYIFVILGSTCTGKTSLSLELCKKYDGEIISADSRQLYKHMDLGTGKLPIHCDFTVEKQDGFWTMDGINIWGYDLVDPSEIFTAYDFSYFALERAEGLRAKKTVFLTGGTGFYIDSVTGNVSLSGIKPNYEVRNELEKKSVDELLNLAMSLNLDIVNKSEEGNKQRLIRNIEKSLCTENKSLPLPYLQDVEYVFIGLKADRDILFKNADAWVDDVWKRGLVEEVEGLRHMGFSDSPKLGGLIYGQVSEFLDDKISSNECVQKMKYAMHGYIRRQETYFKKMPNITWLDISKDSYKQNVYNQVESYVG